MAKLSVARATQATSHVVRSLPASASRASRTDDLLETPPPRSSHASGVWRPVVLGLKTAAVMGTGIAAGAVAKRLANDTKDYLTLQNLVGVWVGFTGMVAAKDVLFGARMDGIMLKTLTFLRRYMPTTMPTRNEARIDYPQTIDLRRTLAFIKNYNSEHNTKITVWQVFLAALIKSADHRPGLQRFAAGGAIFQMPKPCISFTVKREISDHAPIRCVKYWAPPTTPFATLVEEFARLAHEERHDGTLRTAEKEIRFGLKMLPRRALMQVPKLERFLDYYGLLPAAFTDPNPLYCNIFATNTGTIGLDDVKHHLYELGTCSLFVTMGVVGPHVFAGPEGVPVQYDAVKLNWTFDERINDAQGCKTPLARLGKLFENPELMLQDQTIAQVDKLLEEDARALERAFQREQQER